MADEVRDEVNEKASSLAVANPELMEGTEDEKEAIKKLLDTDSELSWEARVAKHPHANEKFQKFWASAESTIDKDLIQAQIIMRHLDMIERIEQLITTAQRRYDGIIRELDRHRFIRNQLDSVQNIVEAEFKTIKPTNVPKITNKKVA